MRGSAMFCMRRIADEHNHASCAAVKTQNCTGKPAVYIADDVETAALATANARAEQEAARNEAEKPSTLLGVTKDAVQKSGETAQKAGETIGAAGQTVGEAIKNSGQAVGDAAKKTWRCIGSGLKEC